MDSRLGSLIRAELAPLMREGGKKLLLAGVAGLGARLAKAHPLVALAVGLASVVAGIVFEALFGEQPPSAFDAA